MSESADDGSLEKLAKKAGGDDFRADSPFDWSQTHHDHCVIPAFLSALSEATAALEEKVKSLECIEAAYMQAHQLLTDLGVGEEGLGVDDWIKLLESANATTDASPSVYIPLGELGSGTKSVTASTDDSRQEKSMADPENPYHETWKKAHAIADKLDPQSVSVPHDCLQEKEARSLDQIALDAAIQADHYNHIKDMRSRQRSIAEIILLVLQAQRDSAVVVHPDTKENNMKNELIEYLDQQTITSDNIGEVRRSCFMPWDSKWNGFVRDETATRENKSSYAAMSDTDKIQPK